MTGIIAICTDDKDYVRGDPTDCLDSDLTVFATIVSLFERGS